MAQKPLPESEDGFKKFLTPAEYDVLREKGTEAPFSGEYVHEKADGTYECKACGNPLFSSTAKFDSGTGWPSFDQALPDAIEHHQDMSYGMAPPKIWSRGGPPPRGLRFSANPFRFGKMGGAGKLGGGGGGSHLGHVFD